MWRWCTHMCSWLLNRFVYYAKEVYIQSVEKFKFIWKVYICWGTWRSTLNRSALHVKQQALKEFSCLYTWQGTVKDDLLVSYKLIYRYMSCHCESSSTCKQQLKAPSLRLLRAAKLFALCHSTLIRRHVQHKFKFTMVPPNCIHNNSKPGLGQ